jgi:hypothetical protein
MEDAIYQNILTKIQAKGFAIAKIKLTKQL